MSFITGKWRDIQEKSMALQELIFIIFQEFVEKVLALKVSS